MAILLGHRSREARITALAFGSSVVVLAGAIGYHVSHPPGEASWAGVGYAFFPEIYMKTLLRNALILSPERYAIHPRTLLEPNHLAFFAGTIALIVILAVPKLRRFWNVSATGDSPNRALAIAMGAIAIGPFLLACNPLIVPQLVQILGTAIPIPRIPGQYESLMLAAQFGAAAAALWAVARFVRNVRYGNAIAVLLTLAVVCATIVMPFNRPRARAILTRLAAGQNPDMLRLTGLPLFSGLARLPPGIVAIGLPDSESVLMTTPHYVVASTRMTEERQRDSNTIVRFAVPPERMRELVAQHRVDYVVVPLGSNILINGQFSGDTEPWYTPPTFSTIAIVAGGEMGTCLQLTRIEYPAQFATQNVPLEPGQAYRLEGYVKSGSSGDETFAIQMYGANVSGTAPVAAVTGRTTASWVKHSVTFTAAATELSVVLRKISETAGTMLFDSATLVPLESALDRFRRSEIFEEIFTTAEHAVFRVRKN
jgi:hypothetical protein